MATEILIWVPGRRGVEGNEQADRLTRLASKQPRARAPKCLPKEVITKRVMHKQASNWANYTRNKHGKLFIDGPTTKGAEELLSMNRNQLKVTIGLLTPK